MFLSSRDAVISLQASLITAKYVAKTGNPDPFTTTDWVNISCEYMAHTNNANKRWFFFLLLFIYYKNFIFSFSFSAVLVLCN